MICSQVKPQNKKSFEDKIRACRKLHVGDIINWQPSNYIDPSLLGFNLLPVYADYSNHVYYQKVYDEPNIETLLEIDAAIEECISIRGGLFICRISWDTLENFTLALQDMRLLYESLDPDQKIMLTASLSYYFAPIKVQQEYLQMIINFGKFDGINTLDNAMEYFIQSIERFQAIFPEVNTPMKES